MLSASARCCAPSAPSLFEWRLHTREGQTCQRLLTLWARVRGGVLERGERRVDPERLGEALRAGSDVVVAEAANEGGTKVYRKEAVEVVSAAADTLGVGVGSRVLELFERRVDLERLGEGLRALGL